MQNNHVDMYVEFLTEFRNAVGPFDAEKLEHDAQYKLALIEKMLQSADQKLFGLAELVQQDLTEANLH